MTTHTNRDDYWNAALNGQIQVLDYAATNWTSVQSLRAAAYREATARGLTLASAVHDDHHLLVAAFGGTLGGWKTTPSDFRRVADMFTGDPDKDVTVRLAPAPSSSSVNLDPSVTPGLLPPATNLPAITPSLDDPLYTHPGSFWEGRVWEPAAQWQSPYRGDHPVGPQQCTWLPRTEFWDLEDLSWLQERREAGTLYPWELRQGFCPPGTALSETIEMLNPKGHMKPRGWVWQPYQWLELASERCYCTCDLRLDGALVDPAVDRDHYVNPVDFLDDRCAYWGVPEAAKDLKAITPFMDPRAALVPGLMDDAEAREKEYALIKARRDRQWSAK